MSEKKENKVVKIIGSLIMIVIMGVLIFFTFNYYNDLAKKGNQSGNNNDEEEQETPNKEEEEKEIELIKYEKRTITVVNDKKITIDLELTDGGYVLTLNDEAFTSVSPKAKIKYATSNNTLVFVVESDDSKKVIFASENGENLKEYKYILKDEIKYNVSNPYIDEEIKNYIYLKGNKVYITFTRNIDDLNPKDIVQLSYMFDTTKDNFIDNYEEVYKYTYEDYIDKRQD